MACIVVLFSVCASAFLLAMLLVHLALHSSTVMPIFFAHSSKLPLHCFLSVVLSLTRMTGIVLALALVALLVQALPLVFINSSRLTPIFLAQASGDMGLQVLVFASVSLASCLADWPKLSRLMKRKRQLNPITFFIIYDDFYIDSDLLSYQLFCLDKISYYNKGDLFKTCKKLVKKLLKES